MIETVTFNYCPKCGADVYRKVGSNQFLCGACRFTYFQNVAASAAAIIECRNQILVCVRKYDPCKGMLGLAGGFVDINESAGSALKREVCEELKIHFNMWKSKSIYMHK